MRQATKDGLRESLKPVLARKGSLTYSAILTVTALLLIHLKIHGIIGWSWFWVTLPIWVGWFGILVVLPVLALLFIAVSEWAERRQEKRNSNG